MHMPSPLNISLPEHISSYVQAEAEAGDYATPDEFIFELVRENKERRKQALEARLLEALDDPTPPLVLTAQQVEDGHIVELIRTHLKQQS
jgi:Arc/MetJ-type ribon-helix-helix transcriptional regulator